MRRQIWFRDTHGPFFHAQHAPSHAPSPGPVPAWTSQGQGQTTQKKTPAAGRNRCGMGPGAIMIVVYKPSEEDLDDLIEETAERNPNWQKDCLDGIARELHEDPARYRSYGPYWWLLKKALLEAGYREFGSFLDAAWYEKLDYGSSAYNLAAAWGYSDWAAENGSLYALRHTYALRDTEMDEVFEDEIWEEATYVLEDKDMEERR